MPHRHLTPNQLELERLKAKHQNCSYGLMSMVIGAFALHFILVIQSIKIYRNNRSFEPLNGLLSGEHHYCVWWVLAGLAVICMGGLLICAKATDKASHALRDHYKSHSNVAKNHHD